VHQIKPWYTAGTEEAMPGSATSLSLDHQAFGREPMAILFYTEGKGGYASRLTDILTLALENGHKPRLFWGAQVVLGCPFEYLLK
jgi:hypothetical protein